MFSFVSILLSALFNFRKCSSRPVGTTDLGLHIGFGRSRQRAVAEPVEGRAAQCSGTSPVGTLAVAGGGAATWAGSEGATLRRRTCAMRRSRPASAMKMSRGTVAGYPDPFSFYRFH
jgi:hypothetical protein